MRVDAKLDRSLAQIRLVKRGGWDGLMNLKDAREAYEAGQITEYNKCFARLVEYDFDVTKVLDFYKRRRAAVWAARRESRNDK